MPGTLFVHAAQSATKTAVHSIQMEQLCRLRREFDLVLIDSRRNEQGFRNAIRWRDEMYHCFCKPEMARCVMTHERSLGGRDAVRLKTEPCTSIGLRPKMIRMRGYEEVPSMRSVGRRF